MRHFQTLLALALVSCNLSRTPLHTTYPPATNLEVPHSNTFLRDRTAKDGSPDYLSATRSFMRAVFGASHNAKLLHDEAFCRRYLSANLRQRIAEARLQFDRRIVGREPRPEDAHAGNTGNQGTILSAWDTPTSFRLAGHHTSTRDYTVNDEIHRDTNAVVDVIYIWGEGTQYEGDQRLTSVMLTKESGRWYVDDLYTHDGVYCSPDHLYRYLVK